MKNNKKNKKEKRNRTITRQQDNLNMFLASVLVTILLITFGLSTVFGENKQYSVNENRYLAMPPNFSFASVKDGTFMKDTEEYISDQFVFRDALVKTRTGIDVFFGKREINGVYIGRQHFLFEKPVPYQQKRITKTVATMEEIANRNPSVHSYFALAPNSTEILSDYLPLNAPTENQTLQIYLTYNSLKKVSCIDICQPLKDDENPETLYYKTDHHWTTRGAVTAARVILHQMEPLKPVPDYRILPLTNEFQGTLASSSGIFSATDTVSIALQQNEVPYTVKYVEEKKETSSVFVSEKLNGKSKYDVFFGGNFAQINIETKSKSQKNLLVIKDSYANCVIPLLLPSFKNVVVVDPRYYNGNLQELIEKEGITDILWLYNVNTFLNDTSINEKLS